LGMTRFRLLLGGTEKATPKKGGADAQANGGDANPESQASTLNAADGASEGVDSSSPSSAHGLPATAAAPQVGPTGAGSIVAEEAPHVPAVEAEQMPLLSARAPVDSRVRLESYDAADHTCADLEAEGFLMLCEDDKSSGKGGRRVILLSVLLGLCSFLLGNVAILVILSSDGSGTRWLREHLTESFKLDVDGHESKWQSHTETVDGCSSRVQIVKDDFAQRMKHQKEEYAHIFEDSSRDLEKVTSAMTSQHQRLNSATAEVGALKQDMQRMWHPTPVTRSEAPKKWAYVMMAYDEPGKPTTHLWGVLAMARSIQLLSQYPLLVLTNRTEFPDGSDVNVTLSALGAQVLPVHEVPVPTNLPYERWKVAWWKIQIWALTDYEKLIWLDTDAMMYRSMDYVFERNWMWAQRDDWLCKLNQEDMCSGFMLLYPNMSDYKGIQDFGISPSADLSKGDQLVIKQYFDNSGRPLNLLSDVEAAFGQCIGTAPSPYMEPNRRPVVGVWNIPSFVHKSGGWASDLDSQYFNVCFQHNVTKQLFRVASETINVCHYHALGATWRSRFCEAITLGGLTQASVRAYCSDDCWVRGMVGNWNDSSIICGPVSSGLAQSDFAAAPPGIPLPMMESFEQGLQ